MAVVTRLWYARDFQHGKEHKTVDEKRRILEEKGVVAELGDCYASIVELANFEGRQSSLSHPAAWRSCVRNATIWALSAAVLVLTWVSGREYLN